MLTLALGTALWLRSCTVPTILPVMACAYTAETVASDRMTPKIRMLLENGLVRLFFMTVLLFRLCRGAYLTTMMCRRSSKGAGVLTTENWGDNKRFSPLISRIARKPAPLDDLRRNSRCGIRRNSRCGIN